MAANGPALDQRVVAYQGAGATYTVPILNPDGTKPDLTGATAAWWVGPLPARVAGGAQTIAGQPGAFTKALAVVNDGAGTYSVVLDIAEGDLTAYAPGGLWQHEIWITELAKPPYPATIGPLVIHGTVKGGAA